MKTNLAAVVRERQLPRNKALLPVTILTIPTVAGSWAHTKI